MVRKKEFIKESEARIIIYLKSCANFRKTATYIAEKLKIDYSYVMKLLEAMYQKGWVKCHKYNWTNFFDLTAVSPIKEAIKRVEQGQQRLH